LKVLVTGSAGFIASKVAEFLLNQNVKVIGIDNMNDYYDPRLKYYRVERLTQNPNFKFQKMDIEDKKKVFDLFEQEKFDIVYNLAARAGVRASIENPHIYLSTNTEGTLNVLQAMVRTNVPKIVLASTSSLYAGQKIPFSEELPVNTPISPYAATKKAAEAMCYSYHHLYNLDVSIVRYFTVFGPAGRPDMSIFRFIKWVLEGQRIDVFGDGSQTRDFTYVDDIARGTILAGKKLGYEIINLGGGRNPISLNTVISKIEKLTNKKAIYNNLPFHNADITETWADISKAKRILNWEPEIGFDEGLKKTVDWCLDNYDFCKSIKL